MSASFRSEVFMSFSMLARSVGSVACVCRSRKALLRAVSVSISPKTLMLGSQFVSIARDCARNVRVLRSPRMPGPTTNTVRIAKATTSFVQMETVCSDAAPSEQPNRGSSWLRRR